MQLHERTLDVSAPPHMLFGVDAVKSLPEHVRGLGKSAVLLVTDPGLVRAGVAAQIEAILEGASIRVVRFDAVDPNPSTDNIKAGSAAYHASGLSDAAVVSLGGGSAMDAAKGIALHITNPVEDVVDLDYRADLKNPALPIIAIPTTAGTGAETNTFGVITNPATHRKFYVGNASAQAKLMLLDPRLTVALPPAPTAATGMDVFSHAIESLVSRNANPYADGINLEVIRTVGQWLPIAYREPSNLEARSQMLLASSIVGQAFRTTGLGMAHAIGHSLGGQLNLPHGLALALVMAAVMRYNMADATVMSKYARAAFALGVGNTAQSEEENANAAVAKVEQLTAAVGITQRLRDVGVTDERLEPLVIDSIEDVVLYNNPIQPSVDDMRAIITQLL
ncbi:MAG: iron-containing alcohol dehydrogenase family protein [Phototrophicaceae bacterium]|jgi:alcohol dehydrogenase